MHGCMSTVGITLQADTGETMGIGQRPSWGRNRLRPAQPGPGATMSEPDAALTAEFAPPSREAWLALVAKVLKGGDFDKRLVSRTADGIAVQPLYTRADAVAGAAATGRSSPFPGGWDIRQRQLEPDPTAANTAILEDLEGGA